MPSNTRSVWQNSQNCCVDLQTASEKISTIKKTRSENRWLGKESICVCLSVCAELSFKWNIEPCGWSDPERSIFIIYKGQNWGGVQVLKCSECKWNSTNEVTRVWPFSCDDVRPECKHHKTRTSNVRLCLRGGQVTYLTQQGSVWIDWKWYVWHIEVGAISPRSEEGGCS